MEISYLSGGALVSIEFDATIQEHHVKSVQAPEHNVEKGVNISDHIRPELAKLTIQCLVTNTPTRVPRTNADGVTGKVRALDVSVDGRRPTTRQLELSVKQKGSLPIGIPGIGAALAGSGVLDSTQTAKVNTLDFVPTTLSQSAAALQFDADFDRVRSVYDTLTKIINDGTLVSLHTSVEEYENMVLLNMSAPRTVPDGQAITFTLDARQIRFVASKRVKAPKIPLGAKKVNKGAKPAERTKEDLASIGWDLKHGSPFSPAKHFE